NWCDLFVIAPASANTIAKITAGQGDNLLTVLALATTRPMVLAPTMDADMFINPVTQQNLATLKERGCFVIPPGEGEHASGLKGPGRFPDIDPIVRFIEDVLGKVTQDLKGKKILVTAGPTYEAIGPVRFVGNRSSGKMGFAIAKAATLRGAIVTLVAGPVHLETPRNVKRVDVESAKQMYEAVMEHSKKAEAVIMAAAVSDYAPVSPAKQKIKKQSKQEKLELSLAATQDILLSLGERKKSTMLVGFALETENGLANAKEKLKKKNLDLIVMNSLSDEGAGFGSDTNVVTIIDKKGRSEKLPKLPKFDVANEILDRVKILIK
ncbi:MAG: bifunctional phosphopantothenoylcysteine decarboxylase/phosphopantothenate--cysteine ligase CoaBC, partial [Ignavibacteriales bacterium]|nr:bifunctional phosphopantothenoylcysteine decarboxylase/phosphopantothenate--cysteine ligase CoaBC [Ignavibacteriales bacterium]